MATNPFRAFIPYLVDGSKTYLPLLDGHKSHDPSAGSWRTVGLIRNSESTWMQDLDGAGQQYIVQFNERILPGKVRDEHLAKAVLKLAAQEGRPVTKKEYAQLRDQVEFDLLPKAFIRRTQVYVTLTEWPDHPDQRLMLVFTSSQKRADDVVSLMRGVLGDGLAPYQMSPKRPLVDILTNLALHGEGDTFYPDDSIILKGHADGQDKRTIRIKDRDVDAHDVQALLKQEYKAHELGIRRVDDEGETDLRFVVNDNFVFKRLEMPDVKMGGRDEFFAFNVLCIRTFRDMLDSFVDEIAGPLTLPPPPSKPEAPAIDLDDEEL